jgi:molybdopterin-guanine dinucleotide biosynthesis protein B
MVEVAVVGAKNAGKTTVIEGLVRYLVGEGYRVATIKHTSHSHRFDTHGKDSYRHRQAGAALAVAESDEEVAVFAQPDFLDASRFQTMTRQQIDIWIVEGDRIADRPKILVTRHLDEWHGTLPKNVVATIGPQQVEGVPVHFEAEDHRGLGAFVRNVMLDKTTETQQ